MGIPFQVRNPMNFHNIKTVNTLEQMESEIAKDEENLSSDARYDEVFSSAQEEARIIIREAELEAFKLVEDAQEVLKEHRRVLEEEARSKGYEEGIIEAKRQYDDILREAEFIKEHAKVEYKEVLAGIEEEAVSLILDIARKVISDEVTLNKEAVIYIVKQAIGKCTNKEDVTVRLCTEDFNYLSENLEELTSKVDGLGEIELKKDASLRAGACIIETPYGSVDAGIETKLNKIEEEFIAAIDKE